MPPTYDSAKAPRDTSTDGVHLSLAAVWDRWCGNRPFSLSRTWRKRRRRRVPTVPREAIEAPSRRHRDAIETPSRRLARRPEERE
ncbi:hypothetical protein EYF80_065107 [Liparis tanakae]|uniref:Uncharacterized protein n=1 Tax=Liparis tanakae TaxID=230148 RepID=A0A4Z2E7K4_9TELE|nr:hypothetical protein EYF80_065107 [Liparis tanakae]